MAKKTVPKEQSLESILWNCRTLSGVPWAATKKAMPSYPSEWYEEVFELLDQAENFKKYQ